jgi:hypothetical protein
VAAKRGVKQVPTEPKTLSNGLVIRFDNDIYSDGSMANWFFYMTNSVHGYAIKETGYDLQQVKAIEYAFESAERGDSEDDWNYNGLIAVFDVLAKIHGVDIQTANEVKKQLV